MTQQDSERERLEERKAIEGEEARSGPAPAEPAGNGASGGEGDGRLGKGERERVEAALRESELRYRTLALDITERKRAEEAWRQRGEDLGRLLEVSKTLAGTLDLTTVLQAGTDGASRLLGWGSAAIYLLEGEWLRLSATTPPLPPEFPECFRRCPLTDHPRIQQALATGRAVVLPDTATAELTAAERTINDARGLRTLIFLPLVAGEQTLGTLIVGAVGAPWPVTEDLIDLARALANLAALAVVNSQLYGAGQRHVAALEREVADRQRAEAEREKLQVQLAHAQKMESVGRLAGGVAHDFNNMLQAILGHADLALQNLPPDSPVHEHLLEIRGCAQRSADLTRQLLAFARKQTIAPKVLNLNETIEGMLRMLGRLIGEDIELVWRPGRDLWPVRLDPSQVDQILANLCVNARDAIDGVGRVIIETGRVVLDDVSCAQQEGVVPGDYVRLSVSDNGCGMDPETRLHLFEPFFTTKDVGKGTGLGLPTVYGVVKQNHGFVQVDSEPGRGTTFQIYLPRHADPTPEGEADPQPRETGHGNETILLVEDEPAILRLSQRVLEALGYTVLTARTPSEAIRLAREHAGRIDLLLTDVVMPEMNGRELARNILAQRPHIKRLFSSGYTANVIAPQGVLDPGVHFIPKPYSPHALGLKVREALDS